MISVLESERLILRSWRKEDFPAYAAFWADEVRTRYIGGPKYEWQAWTAFAAMSGEWSLNGYGMFAVVLKATGEVAGYAGLWHPPYVDEPELAWSLYAGYEGQGYAVEAARQAQLWAAEERGLPPLMSFVHPENFSVPSGSQKAGSTSYAANNPARRTAPALPAQIAGMTHHRHYRKEKAWH